MKPWYTSKTLWVNLLALAGSVVMLFTGMSAEAWAGYTGTALALINIVLRLVTGEGISLGGGADDGGSAT